MPTKAEMYAQMAEQVAAKLTDSWQEWTGFLTTAARLYKYTFQDQMMIYAQRPDATACAEYDLWNDKMGRYVRRGSKGIALMDDSGDRPRLRYVFDISDTGTREHSRTPGCGSWRNSTRDRSPPCWSAAMEHLETIWPSRLSTWPESWLRHIGRIIGGTSSTSLTVRSWRSTMIITSRCNSRPSLPSASPTP